MILTGGLDEKGWMTNISIKQMEISSRLDTQIPPN